MLPPLPHRDYYRAGTLGEGSYGAVACVYDDDGNEYAAKVPARATLTLGGGRLAAPRCR